MSDALDKLLPPVQAAVRRYAMLPAGSRVAVGLSGGKDSVVLLALLARLRRFYDTPFTLTAITLDPCFEGSETDYAALTAWCAALGVPHQVIRTRLWEVVFAQRQEPNPCSLCARLRRGALHKAAVQAGCDRVALGHHQDDAAQTFVMNLLAGGTAACFSPAAYLSRRELWLIRPLVFLEENRIAGAAAACGLPVVKSRCPVDGDTHRARVAGLLGALEHTYGPLSAKLVGALQKGGISGW